MSLHLSDTEIDFLGAILTANVSASQDAANRVLHFTEQERDEAQQALVDLYDAVSRAHYDAPVQIRAIGRILDGFFVAADGAGRRLDSRRVVS